MRIRPGRRAAAAATAGIAALAAVAALVVIGAAEMPPPAGRISTAGLPGGGCTATGATAATVFAPRELTAGTDSTAVIQRAIDAAGAAGGGVVRLPAGTFLLNGHLLLRDGVKLTGAGPQTVLKAGPRFLDSPGPAGGYPLITTDGAANVTIASLTADQSGDVLNGNLPGRLAAYLIDVRHSRNAVVDGVWTRNPFTYSIAVVGSSNFCVTGSHTRVATSGRYDQLDGIHILDSHTGQVIGNDIDQRLGTDGDDGLAAHTIGAPVYDVLYAGNTVRGGAGGNGMQLAVGDYPIHGITISGNRFWGSPFGIRTGYYGTGPGGAVRDITITGNTIEDLVPGLAFPEDGNAIEIGGFGVVAPVTHITVTGNRACHAGEILVTPGPGTVVAGNTTCP